MTAGTQSDRVQQNGHVPVMLDEVLEHLCVRQGGVYVDGTFGAGGYTRAILETADCKVYAIDRDLDAVTRAEAMAKEYPNRLYPLYGTFGSIEQLLASSNITQIDGIVLDIGVSSIQLSSPERGFSFREEGPLDMRMGNAGISAKDVVNDMAEAELADIIFTYGEERASRRIAKKIVESRKIKTIETTKELARIIHDVLPMHGGIKTDTATKTFQALRIYVNDELGELSRVLAASERLLVEGGRLVVVAFHSLEDSIVKTFMKERAGKTANVSRHIPMAPTREKITFTLEKSGGIKPSDAEIARNPRARSARLRYGTRTAEAAHA